MAAGVAGRGFWHGTSGCGCGADAVNFVSLVDVAR